MILTKFRNIAFRIFLQDYCIDLWVSQQTTSLSMFNCYHVTSARKVKPVIEIKFLLLVTATFYKTLDVNNALVYY